MSNTLRWNPDTHHKDAKERRHLIRKLQREQEEHERKRSFLYQPDEQYELKETDDDSN